MELTAELFTHNFNLSDNDWCSHLKFMITLDYKNLNEETSKAGTVADETKTKSLSNLSSSMKPKKRHWEKQKQSQHPTTLSQGPLASTKNQRASVRNGRPKESEYCGKMLLLQQ